MVWFDLAVFFALTLVNGFFAMSEMALVSSKKARLIPLADAGDQRARLAMDLGENPSRFLSAVQIGITITGILAGAASGATLAARLGGWLQAVFPSIGAFAEEIAFFVVILAMTFVTLVFGELVPKRIAMARPEPIALAVAGAITMIARITSPFVALLSGTSRAVLKLLRIREDGNKDVTEEEVKHVISEGVEAGILDEDEREMLEGVMRIADRPVRAIMTPRPDVFWIDPRDPPELIRKDVMECPYSLMVAAEGSIDQPLGVIFKKDLLTPALRGDDLDVMAYVRKPIVVPEGSPVLSLLALFRETPVHCAFVVDEYGALEGLVTLTDIVEGITGDLADVDAPMPAPTVERDDGSYLIDGNTDVDDVAKLLSVSDLPKGSFHTVGGLILSVLKRIPREGDKARIGDFQFEVVDMDGRRIDKVMIYKTTPAATASAEETA